MSAPAPASPFGPMSFRERLTVRRRAPILRRLKEEVRPGPEVRLLDLGGGTGVTTERFAHGSGEVVVLEPDPRRVARGRAARPALRFVEGVAERLPFEDGRFDRIVSLLSFHHFQDPVRALSETYRVLAPGGSLTVCDLDPASRQARAFHFLHALTSHGRLTFAEAEEMERRARTAGFARVQRDRWKALYLVTATK